LAPVRVLVVAADASERSRMLAELRNVLPAGTVFVEAEETWRVLARAAASHMVVLVDDLPDISSKALVRLLARRQPTLPVLALGGTPPLEHADAAG
jgi:DNA-binding NtrC family response regulator